MQPQPPVEQFGQLIALHPDVQIPAFVLRETICTIGRAAECDLVIARNTISRVHARIERVGSRHYLHDAESVNGTFVNTRQIHEPHVLKDHDLIGLGAPTALLRFVDPDPTFRQVSRLRYDSRAKVFVVDAAPLQLTPLQFRLLEFLYQHAGEPCSREQCAAAVWGRDYDPGVDAANLDRLVNSLRARIDATSGVEGTGMALIVTRRAQGYSLVL
jgi:DNA-binding response OmpR family regulator